LKSSTNSYPGFAKPDWRTSVERYNARDSGLPAERRISRVIEASIA